MSYEPGPLMHYSLGADASAATNCDPNTQYFDSQYTQKCRAFADVGPPMPASSSGMFGLTNTQLAVAAVGVGVVGYMLLKKKRNPSRRRRR